MTNTLLQWMGKRLTQSVLCWRTWEASRKHAFRGDCWVSYNCYWRGQQRKSACDDKHCVNTKRPVTIVGFHYVLFWRFFYYSIITLNCQENTEQFFSVFYRQQSKLTTVKYEKIFSLPSSEISIYAHLRSCSRWAFDIFAFKQQLWLNYQNCYWISFDRQISYLVYL